MSASATGSPLSSASASSASRGEPTSVTAQPSAKSRIRARVYSRRTVASVPSTDTSLLARGGAGRLDRRHRADERHREARAQLRQHQRRGGVAGDHHEVGPVRRDQLVHHRQHARRPARPRPDGHRGRTRRRRHRRSARPAAPSTISRKTVSPPSPESKTRMIGADAMAAWIAKIAASRKSGSRRCAAGPAKVIVDTSFYFPVTDLYRI